VHLRGYPGVSGHAHRTQPQAASGSAHPAHRDPSRRRHDTRTGGIVDPGVIPASQCHPVTAAGLRVYRPNQTRSRSYLSGCRETPGAPGPRVGRDRRTVSE